MPTHHNATVELRYADGDLVRDLFRDLPRTLFYEEIAGGVLLLAAAGVLGYSGKAGR